MEFSVSNTSRHLHSRAAWCKLCHSNYQKEWRKINIGRIIQRDREYNRQNSAKRVQSNREHGQNKRYYQRHRSAELRRHRQYNQLESTKEIRRKAYLKRQYNITVEDHNLLLKTQNGRCAICRRGPSDGVVLHVDHDHTTSNIRGILCGSCNRLIGIAGESVVRLQAATNYLSTRVKQ